MAGSAEETVHRVEEWLGKDLQVQSYDQVGAAMKQLGGRFEEEPEPVWKIPL